MAKKITINDVKHKVGFLNQYLDDFGLKLQIENDNYFILFKVYGLEGSDCVYAGPISGCNDYLNRIIRKYDLKSDYMECRGSK